MCNEIYAAIIGALVGCIGGGVVTYIGAVSIQKKSVRHEANVRFCESFWPVIEAFRSDPALGSDIAKHFLAANKTAVYAFRFYLSVGAERRRFDEAWRKYSEDMSNYVDFGGKQDGHDGKSIAIDRIHALLQFADYKD